LFEHLDGIIEKGTSMGASYVEARGENSFVEYIQMDDGRVNALTRRIEQGVALRVLVNGAWGFVTTGQLDELDEAVEDAISMAKAAARTRREPIELAEVDTYEDSVEADIERDPQNVPIEEKIQYLKDLTTAARNYDERISAVTGKLRSISGETFIVTSEGSRIKKPKLLVWVYPWISGKEGTQLTAARYEEASTHEGWEFMENTATPEMIAEEAAKRVVLQLDGVKSKAGSFPCVLGPRVIGVLAHEALGHLAEADLTVNSAFAGKVGEIVAAEGVNMIDDGTDANNLGTEAYDEEGVPPSKVEIIKDSVLNELMTNREYAAKTGQRCTGNARAESYLYPPIIRMRNTYFEKGNYAPDEIFEGIDFGYYCADFRGGQAQMNASFQVGIQEAYEIVDGELGKPIKDLSISGIATDSLFKIEGVANEGFPYELGRCGKGQTAYVASGGPRIRFSKGGITFGGQE